jgi:hypothetical protein
MTPDDPRADLAESMVPVACDFACRVRDGDAEGIARLAEANGWDTETTALLVVLAAGWDIEDRSVRDLLAWTDGLDAVMGWRQRQLPLAVPGRPATEPCGTYAAWARHKRRGEEVDRACYRAWQRYRAERRLARRDRAAEASDAA